MGMSRRLSAALGLGLRSQSRRRRWPARARSPASGTRSRARCRVPALTSGRTLPRRSRWTRRAAFGPGIGAEGGRGRAGDQLGRALGAQARRWLRALPRLRGAGHGGQAGRQAPGHQDLGGPRHRRPHGDDPRRRHQARLPRLGALKDGAYFVDPYYKRDDSVYLSYFARDLSDDERFVERRPRSSRRRSRPRRRRRPRGPAAHLPARADHGPELRHLPRRRPT